MPFSVALPAPNVEILDRWAYPWTSAANGEGATVTNMAAFAKIRRGLDNATGLTGPLGSVAVVGGTFPQIQNANGRLCARNFLKVQAGGWYPSMVHPALTGAAAFNAGSQVDPHGVVAVWNVHFRSRDALSAGYSADFNGWFFGPDGAPPNARDMQRLGASPLNGFGWYLNDDGAGNLRLEYLSWSGAVALERIAAPIPDITLWSTARFTITSAGGGARPSRLDVDVNGIRLASRLFGSPELASVTASSAAAIRFAFYQTQQIVAPATGYDWLMDGWTSRFNPEGLEIQPLTA